MTNICNIGIYHFLLLALILFAIGLFGAIVSKNILKILISVEIMFCGVTLNLATFATYSDVTHLKGSILTLFAIVHGAIHLAVGIAIVINIKKFKNSTDIENIGELKG